MDQDKNTEVVETNTEPTEPTTETKVETEVEPTNTEVPQDQQPPQKSNSKVTMYILLAAAIVVGILTIHQMGLGSSKDEGCKVIPTSAFGQGPQQMWMELDTDVAAAEGAKFTLEVPENPIAGYTNKKYEVYTYQIYEIRYYNDAQEEGMRISKGIMCGNPVYDVNEKYKSTNIVEVGDLEVTEYGDGTNVSIATWESGDYSYFIAAWKDALAKDEMEELIKQIQ